MVLLPGLVFVGLVLLLSARRPTWGWRRSFVRGAILAASAAILGTETLSLVGGVTRSGLALAWSLLLAAEAAWFVVAIRRGQGLRFPPVRLPCGRLDRALLLAVVLIVLVVGAVAYLSPPNTWDSLNYHMARVAHWAQLRAIRPYATGIEVQNGHGPGAETLVLQLYILASGDRWVNFVQWLAMVTCLVAASRLTSGLGATPLGETLATLLVAALPIGIAEASSTMNDYVLAAWIMAVASETLDVLAGSEDRGSVFTLSLAAGLAASVKVTAFVYLLPFAVLAGVAIIRREPKARVAVAVAVAGAAMLLLNLGQWSRNLAVFGNPVGVPAQVQLHALELRTPAGWISNLTRHAGMHAFTPWRAVNRQVMRAISKIHQLIGVDLNDPRTTAIGEFTPFTPMTEETRSTNWYHAWLYLLSGALMIVGFRRFRSLVFVYAAAALATFVLFCFVFKWQVFSSRLLLPFFVLLAPVAARAVTAWFPSWLVGVLGAAILVACWPWLTGIDNRPLLPKAGSVVTILNTPREDLYAWPGSIAPHQAVAERILAQGCSTVGIAISGAGAEYPFWAFLGAPRSDLRIDWIVSGTPSGKYEDPDFAPCAVICDWSCPADSTTIRGLVLADTIGGLRLFLPPGS